MNERKKRSGLLSEVVKISGESPDWAEPWQIFYAKSDEFVRHCSHLGINMIRTLIETSAAGIQA